jgi:5-methylthioribose kinase
VDFTSIVDPVRRARCERRALQFGRQLLVHTATFSSIEDVLAGAQAARDGRLSVTVATEMVV